MTSGASNEGTVTRGVSDRGSVTSKASDERKVTRAVSDGGTVTNGASDEGAGAVARGVSDGGGAGMVVGALRSSTFQLNISCFCHRQTDATHLILQNVFTLC